MDDSIRTDAQKARRWLRDETESKRKFEFARWESYRPLHEKMMQTRKQLQEWYRDHRDWLAASGFRGLTSTTKVEIHHLSIESFRVKWVPETRDNLPFPVESYTAKIQWTNGNGLKKSHDPIRQHIVPHVPGTEWYAVDFYDIPTHSIWDCQILTKTQDMGYVLPRSVIVESSWTIEDIVEKELIALKMPSSLALIIAPYMAEPWGIRFNGKEYQIEYMDLNREEFLVRSVPLASKPLEHANYWGFHGDKLWIVKVSNSLELWNSEGGHAWVSPACLYGPMRAMTDRAVAYWQGKYVWIAEKACCIYDPTNRAWSLHPFPLRFTDDWIALPLVVGEALYVIGWLEEEVDENEGDDTPKPPTYSFSVVKTMDGVSWENLGGEQRNLQYLQISSSQGWLRFRTQDNRDCQLNLLTGMTSSHPAKFDFSCLWLDDFGDNMYHLPLELYAGSLRRHEERIMKATSLVPYIPRLKKRSV